jgi:RNA polymerase sigma-70 factor (ECF subfamily)
MPPFAPASPASVELDELTLARAQRGDEGACRVLVERYHHVVFAVLGRTLGGASRTSVEDLAQETFLRVFRALPAFSPAGPARLSTWIITIATRLAMDELRQRRPAAVPLGGEPVVLAPDLGERRELGEAIAAAVEGLAADFRVVFVLYELHGLSYRDIAQALELDAGTVKSRLHRARGALRQRLLPYLENKP